MEQIEEDIVIVGAGIAGLTTALGLHRLGIGSLVLECSDSLRVGGYALTIKENGWRALDAVGVGDILRHEHLRLHGYVTTSLITGQQTYSTSFNDNKGRHGASELRRVKRQVLLETLANELPSGTIKYLSKVVAIEESSYSKILHLADGTSIKTKVLIGCDGINSMVAKWLGFKNASNTERYTTRGYVKLEDNHELEPMFMQYFGKRCRVGVLPCDDKGVNWFFTWTPISQDEEAQDPAELKQFVLSKLEKMTSDVRQFIEKTETNTFQLVPLRYRKPWELIMGNISKGNVCILGDALHPMPPDLGQGGNCALEDAVVLARCLGKAFSNKPKDIEEEYKRIEEDLKKYANERRWRCIDLISTAYIMGYLQQSGSKFVNFFYDKFLARFLDGQLLKANFDCGQLK